MFVPFPLHWLWPWQPLQWCHSVTAGFSISERNRTHKTIIRFCTKLSKQEHVWRERQPSCRSYSSSVHTHLLVSSVSPLHPDNTPSFSDTRMCFEHAYLSSRGDGTEQAQRCLASTKPNTPNTQIWKIAVREAEQADSDDLLQIPKPDPAAESCVFLLWKGGCWAQRDEGWKEGRTDG